VLAAKGGRKRERERERERLQLSLPAARQPLTLCPPAEPRQGAVYFSAEVIILLFL
jgi:hypothetical protein